MSKGSSVTQVFTFGGGQAYPSGYVVLSGESKGECRQLMYALFGMRWSMQYEDAYVAGVYKYALREVTACLQCLKPITPPWGDDPHGLEGFWHDHPDGLCECKR